MRDDTYGQELRTLELDRIRIAETCMPAGLRIDDHAHSRAQLCFVLEGTYREGTPGDERVFRPGFMHARAPGVHHANHIFTDEDAVTLLISIDPSRWLALPPWTGPLRILGDLAGEIRAELRREDAASHFALEGLTMLGLARLARATTAAEPPWLGDAISLIERCYAQPLTLGQVARKIGVHRATLAAAFRRFRRTSVGEHIRNVRVARAKEVLARDDAPLAEVALQVGFADQAHFTRVFRELTGMPPGAWRRRLH